VLQVKQGETFVSETDTEVIPKLCKWVYHSLPERVPFSAVRCTTPLSFTCRHGVRVSVEKALQHWRHCKDVCRHMLHSSPAMCDLQASRPSPAEPLDLCFKDTHNLPTVCIKISSVSSSC